MSYIAHAQIKPSQLDRLAAQRRLYSDSKRLQALQIILSVPCVIAWSLLVVWQPALKVYDALWGIAIVLLNVVVFRRAQRSLNENAAKIQELFDCDVLEIDWNGDRVGRKPDAETIAEAAARLRGADRNRSELREWYPTAVDVLPIELARIICQRTNCWWDAKLRRRYAGWTIAVVVSLAGIVLVASLLGGLSLEKFILAGLVPLLPAIDLGMREYDAQVESAASADRLKEHAERLWHKALAGNAPANVLKTDVRQLQDEIYDRRRSSPVVFDWIYRRLRRDDEELMNKGAEALVGEARTALSHRNV